MLFLTRQQLQEHVADEADTETGGDVKRQRHREDRQEGRHADREVIELDVNDRLHHQSAHHDQGSSRSIARNDRDDREDQQASQEEESRDDAIDRSHQV